MSEYVIPFEKLRNTDVALVGGKNASLGEMISQLHAKGVRVPTGFATTANAFNDFLIHNELEAKIITELENLDINDVIALAKSGEKVRKWILNSSFSDDFNTAIEKGYGELIKNSAKVQRLLLDPQQLQKIYQMLLLQASKKVF